MKPYLLSNIWFAIVSIILFAELALFIMYQWWIGLILIPMLYLHTQGWTKSFREEYYG